MCWFHTVSFLLAYILFASAQETASAEYKDDDAFQKSVLSVTNTYRKQHNATNLVWNETLAEVAKQWSGKCKFEHSGGPYGENLASGYANVSTSIIAWGHERVEYNFRNGDFSAETGHFTQLVWKTTTQVGCGRTECNGDKQGGSGDAPGWFLVCEYYPGGNVIGSFIENVQEGVPKEKQRDGPSDPQVPEVSVEVNGGGNSAMSGVRGNVVLLWAAVLVGGWWGIGG